jgi:hypothetical protein
MTTLISDRVSLEQKNKLLIYSKHCHHSDFGCHIHFPYLYSTLQINNMIEYKIYRIEKQIYI